MRQYIQLTRRHPSDIREERFHTIQLIVRQCRIGVGPAFRIIRAIIDA